MAKNEASGNRNTNGTYLQRLTIQKYAKSSIRENWRNKTDYLSRNSTTLKFVKSISMPNLLKSLWYIKCSS